MSAEDPIIVVPSRPAKGRGCAIALLVAIALAVIFFANAGVYVDYLWYALDARQPQVFFRRIEVQGWLFTLAFLVAWPVIYFNARLALRYSQVYLDRPASTGQAAIAKLVDVIRHSGAAVVKWLAPLLALLVASNFGANWQTYLLWRNQVPFGKVDPIFGFDLSYMVFVQPWYRAVSGALSGLAILCLVVCGVIYVGLQVLAALARIELGRPHVRAHISAMLGGAMVLIGLGMWLKRYEFGLIDGAQFTGAGFADMQRLAVQGFMAIAAILLGVGTIVNGRLGKAYAVPVIGGAAWFIAAILALGVYPGIVQRFKVEPDKLRVEGPFAQRAMAMTRYAYNIDQIDSRDFDVKAAPSDAELTAAKPTLDNMRLWDPNVVREASEVLQAFRPYYRFRDVDIDRYTIGGKRTMVMVSPRDMRLEGLSDSARTWVNERLVYTHGYGLVATPVNQMTPNGEPKFVLRDLPPTGPDELKLEEPRMYYSDYVGDEMRDGYGIVDTNVDEFDYTAQDSTVTHRWKGEGGIPIGNLFRRLALAIALGDGNLLVSGNVRSDSRVLRYRGVFDRAVKIFPFLKFDDDPYVTIVNGRALWILDGYTMTDRIPYSETQGDGDNKFNYIRNPIKVTIDAYSGETHAYAIDPNEPILKAWRGVYPGLIEDGGKVPPEVRAHFRYPEAMFMDQARILTTYHVSDPTSFLNNNDAWELPAQRGSGGGRSLLPAYYVQMKLPDEDAEGFMLMLPFTPRSKANMSGWLGAHCDPDSYGKLTLYKFAKGANVAGPEQMETSFTSDPKITATNLQLKGGGETQIVVGNLLVLPIGSSVMYVETLYPRGSTTGLAAVPRLKKVILALNDRIVIGDSYDDALKMLFQQYAEAPESKPKPQPTPPAGPTTGGDVRTTAREALELYRKADEALKQGDFAKYGEFQRQIRAKLEKIASAK